MKKYKLISRYLESSILTYKAENPNSIATKGDQRTSFFTNCIVVCNESKGIERLWKERTRNSESTVFSAHRRLLN